MVDADYIVGMIDAYKGMIKQLQDDLFNARSNRNCEVDKLDELDDLSEGLQGMSEQDFEFAPYEDDEDSDPSDVLNNFSDTEFEVRGRARAMVGFGRLVGEHREKNGDMHWRDTQDRLFYSDLKAEDKKTLRKVCFMLSETVAHYRKFVEHLLEEDEAVDIVAEADKLFEAIDPQGLADRYGKAKRAYDGKDVE